MLQNGGLCTVPRGGGGGGTVYIGIGRRKADTCMYVLERGNWAFFPLD